MEPGFGQNLEGFLIKGNLSLAPSANPSQQGDGSIEGSGTLFFDVIKEYNINNGVNIQDVTFQNGILNIPYTIPSENLTTASVIIDGGLSIKHTRNSSSVTSGGALTIAGGASISKNVNIGGDVDVNNNSIRNVAYPILGSDAVNKDYVDTVATRLSGNFTTGQVIFADSNGDAIRGYDFFTTDTQSLNLSIPFLISNSNGASEIKPSLQVLGGVNIKGDSILEGLVNVSGNSIINVADPVNNYDAVNKEYVDNLIDNLSNITGNFTAGQLIVADTSGSSIRGYESLIYDGFTLSLFSTSNNSFVCYGGISISKSVFIGGLLDVNNNRILNVSDPVDDYDAANKEYVDRYFGNFTSGQLIISDTSGNAITGYDNLTFSINDGTSGTLGLNSYTNLYIENTTNASGLGTGGTLTVSGGASFNKDVYVGGILDVNLQNIKNVADPVDDYDAVNKRYLEDVMADCCNGGGGGISTNIFNLTNNVLVPADIPIFYYDEAVLAFTANVYVQYNNVSTALYTIRGIHCDNNWSITSSYIGTPLGVKFYIRSNSGQGLLQYTNTNTTGFASIRFSTTSNIDIDPSSSQLNIDLLGNIVTFTDISILSYPFTSVDGVKLMLFVSSITDDQCGLFFINSVFSDSKWDWNIHNIGDIVGVDFQVSNSGVIQYKNSNSASDYIVRVVQNSFLTSTTRIVLDANTSVITNINTEDLTFGNVTNFQLSLVANDNTSGKSALYEITGVLDGTIWKLNSRYIGDDLRVKFYVNTISGNTGILQYTNESSNDVNIRYTKNIQNLFEPLTVTLGGTGNSRFNPYAVLRGNGTNPIIGTDDFIYKDYTLTLGSSSSILLNNTTTATGLTDGGSLISYGGASFGKDVFIGGELDVNIKNIRNVADPVLDLDAVNKRYVDTAIDNLDLNNNENVVEQNLFLNNNVSVPTDVAGLYFSNSTVKAFITNIYVEKSNNTSALYTIRGINCGSDWLLTSSLIGNSLGVDFYIRRDATNGYVQYTNQNSMGTTLVKFTTNSLVYTDVTSSQINYLLLSNQSTFTEITPLTFSNSVLDSVKLLIYVSSETDSRYGLVLANCVLKNGIWDINSHSIGNTNGIRFRIRSDVNSSVIEYINTNVSNDYTIRVTNVNISSDLDVVTLVADTLVPDEINHTGLQIPVSAYYFQMTIYVTVPATSKSALYEIQGVVSNNQWNINSRYNGDYTGIKFYMTTVNGVGYIMYTNSNSSNALIRFIKDVPLTTLKPLAVTKGGTNSTYLNPYTILRGNGVNPIIGTDDLIYQNNQLVVGESATIVIRNTSSSVNLTTGSTFVAYGGVSINKELFIGKQLVVKDVDVTPNTEDISAEREFDAWNNVSIPSDVSGFVFTSTNTKSFSAMACVNINTVTDEFDALYEIRGLKKRSGWIIDCKYIGDDIGIDFSIRSDGQIQYTSSNRPDWLSTKIKFRALTTTV
jgi:hypothetical protein